MKLALLNLSNNITNYRTVSSGETISFGKVFEDMGYDVDIISKKAGEYTIAFEDVEDINSYDKLVMVNGAINFFGGKENPIITKNYRLLAKWEKEIYYLFTDIRLPFKQLWPAIEKRGWGYKKDDVWVDNDIIIISQGSDLDKTKKAHKDEDYEYVYFPIEQYYLYLMGDEYATPTEKKHDLVYGGSYRSGAREDKMIEYLFDITDYDVNFFGNIREKQFKNATYFSAPTFDKKVKMDEVRDKISEGVATLIIGDKKYEDNFITLRVWETMTSDAIMLIDKDFDSEQKIMQDDFYYVENKQDIIDRLKLLHDDEFRKKKLEQQHLRVDTHFDEETWLNKFKEVLNK